MVKEGVRKLLIWLVVIIALNLVIDLVSLNVLYGLQKANTMLKGELKEIDWASRANCENEATMDYASCIESGRDDSYCGMVYETDIGVCCADECEDIAEEKERDSYTIYEECMEDAPPYSSRSWWSYYRQCSEKQDKYIEEVINKELKECTASCFPDYPSEEPSYEDTSGIDETYPQGYNPSS